MDAKRGQAVSTTHFISFFFPFPFGYVKDIIQDINITWTRKKIMVRVRVKVSRYKGKDKKCFS